MNYTLRQLKQHVQCPQPGDVWVHRETFKKIVVSCETNISSSWRENIVRNYHAKFLVNENIRSPSSGETYTGNGGTIDILGVNSDWEILIGWNKDWGDESFPDLGCREFLITQEKWEFIVKEFGFVLTPENSEKQAPNSGQFDFVRHDRKFRCAFVCTDRYICAYIEGSDRRLFDSREQLDCWLDSLNHTEIREFGDYPESDAFVTQTADDQKHQYAYRLNSTNNTRIVFKDGDKITGFTDENDFKCWLHSLRRV